MGAFPEIPSIHETSFGARTPVVWTPGTTCFTIAVGVASALDSSEKVCGDSDPNESHQSKDV